MKKIFIILILTTLATTAVWAGQSPASRAADIGLDEKLGRYLPPGLLFHDENGKLVNLKNSIDKPAIIAPIYLGCNHVCPMLLTGLAQVLGELDLVRAGRDFQVIALSFDERDQPASALDKKKNYLKAIGRSFPADAWHFLTGDADNIRKFTESIGFRFQRDGEHDFSHPVALVVVSPDGKIIRYIEGVSFLPFELTMALTEAAEGKIGSPARKVLMYCFSYDPLEKSYVFNILKVTGTVIILFAGGFLIYLTRSTGKQGQ